MPSGADTLLAMCRSIKTLRGEETVTGDDVHAASLQFVRKLSGYRVPSKANAAVFDAAVAEIASASQRLLDALVGATGGPPKARPTQPPRPRSGDLRTAAGTVAP